jgi:hypothetical protein
MLNVRRRLCARDGESGFALAVVIGVVVTMMLSSGSGDSISGGRDMLDTP